MYMHSGYFFTVAFLNCALMHYFLDAQFVHFYIDYQLVNTFLAVHNCAQLCMDDA